MQSIRFCVAVVTGIAAVPLVLANGAYHTTTGTTLADGEVRKIDREAGKLTIRHGPIASMNMPPMTMVFRVKDAAMLDLLATGDRIRFDAAHERGSYTVTHLEKVKY